MLHTFGSGSDGQMPHGGLVIGNIPLQSGTKQVVIKLKTHGNKTITATDTVTPAIKGTSPNIAVN